MCFVANHVADEARDHVLLQITQYALYEIAQNSLEDLKIQICV